MTRRFLLAVVWGFVVHEGAAIGKPKILSLALGKDPKILKANDDANQGLKACGYDVEAIRAESKDELSKRLKEKKWEDRTFVWVTSHGGVLKNGVATEDLSPDEILKLPVVPHKQGFHLMGTAVEKPIIDGKSLQEVLATSIQKPQIFLSACFSGACPTAPGIGLIASCQASNKCYVYDKHPQMLVDLLCSAIGDCVEFRKADRNGDGTISASELSRYWGARLGYEIAMLVISPEQLESVTHKCKENKGEAKFAKGTVVKVNWRTLRKVGKISSVVEQELDLDLFLAGSGYPSKPTIPPVKENIDLGNTEILRKLGMNERSLGLIASQDFEKAKGWIEKNESEFQKIGMEKISLVKQNAYRFECHFPERPRGIDKENLTTEQPFAKSLELISELCKSDARSPSELKHQK